MTTAAEPTTGRRILLCYDGSEEAKRALERVAEIGSAAPTRVTVISVAEPIYRDAPWTGYADPTEEEAHRLLLHEAIEELRRRGVRAAALEPVGRPAAEIVAAAQEKAADLVVVGSSHRRLVSQLLAHSVAAEVVGEALCDVLVVR